MSSATNLISFLRSAESHRSGMLPLGFAREVLWGPIFSAEIRSSTDANRCRWVHDRMNECWFALYARRRVGSGGQSRFLLKGH